MAGRSKQFTSDFVQKCLSYLTNAAKDDRRWIALIHAHQNPQEAERTLRRVCQLDGDQLQLSLQDWLTVYLPKSSWNKMLAAFRQRKHFIDSESKFVSISACAHRQLKECANAHCISQGEILEILIKKLHQGTIDLRPEQPPTSTI